MAEQRKSAGEATECSPAGKNFLQKRAAYHWNNPIPKTWGRYCKICNAIYTFIPDCVCGISKGIKTFYYLI